MDKTRQRLLKINRDFQKLRKLYEQEKDILTELTFTKSTYSDISYMYDNLQNHITKALLTGNEKSIQAIEKQLDNLRPSITWPPRTARIEIQASALVRELSSAEAEQQIASAIRSGFVSSERDFIERTIKEALDSRGVGKSPEDVRDFIAAVNRNIAHHNKESEHRIAYVRYDSSKYNSYDTYKNRKRK